MRDINGTLWDSHTKVGVNNKCFIMEWQNQENEFLSHPGTRLVDQLSYFDFINIILRSYQALSFTLTMYQII